MIGTRIRDDNDTILKYIFDKDNDSIYAIFSEILVIFKYH